MIDISDGLASDLHHICESSGIGAILDGDLIPVDPNLRKILRFDEALDAAINGGEDFELLFTTDESGVRVLNDLPVTRIGTITSESGKLEMLRNGTFETLVLSGFRHF
jgi:thiamine-monophosphate kinase